MPGTNGALTAAPCSPSTKRSPRLITLVTRTPAFAGAPLATAGAGGVLRRAHPVSALCHALEVLTTRPPVATRRALHQFSVERCLAAHAPTNRAAGATRAKFRRGADSTAVGAGHFKDGSVLPGVAKPYVALPQCRRASPGRLERRAPVAPPLVRVRLLATDAQPWGDTLSIHPAATLKVGAHRPARRARLELLVGVPPRPHLPLAALLRDDLALIALLELLAPLAPTLTGMLPLAVDTQGRGATAPVTASALGVGAPPTTRGTGCDVVAGVLAGRRGFQSIRHSLILPPNGFRTRPHTNRLGLMPRPQGTLTARRCSAPIVFRR